MTLSRRSKAPTQISTSLCELPHNLDDMVKSTVALYNVHSTHQGQGGGRHCSDAETGSQQSDHSEDPEDHQVQHIEIKEVHRSGYVDEMTPR